MSAVDLLLPLGHLFAALYGVVIGSFLAVCIVRLPEDRSLLVPSACPCCGQKVRWYDNVPVLSWLWLRGRCRSCGCRIAPLYPLVEALSGVLAVLVFRQVFQDPADLDLVHCAAWVVRFAFLCLALVAGAVDVRHRIIPDQTSIYAAPVGIAAAALLAWLGWEGVGAPMASSWQDAVLGAGAWGGFFALIYASVQLVLRVEGLGWGDVKLVTMFGAWLGLHPGPFLVLMFSSLGGAVAGLLQIALTGRRTGLPLGPWLALAAIAYVLYGDVLLIALFPGVTGW